MCHRNRGGYPNIKDDRHGGQDLTDKDSTSSNITSNENKGDTVTDTKKRWVVNLSGQPLTEAEYRVLTHGPNFAITSRSPHTIECITATEEICQKLGKGKAEELRKEVKNILKKAHP